MELDPLDEQRWADIHTFRHTGCRFDPETGIAEFDYVQHGSGQILEFTEVITFPLPDELPSTSEMDAFHRVLELLYVAVGTIYYKAIAPRAVTLEAVPLAPAAARWAGEIYRRGLAEFSWSWNLPHVLELELAIEPAPGAASLLDLAADDRAPLVAIGGGKDSIVSVEALKAAGFAPAMFAVQRDPTPMLSQMMALSGGLGLLVSRRQDPQLTQLLRSNTVRLGHVPVTAINSLAGVAAAVLHGLGPAVMSNERSADEGNIVWHGHEVNHQWSKGVFAEELLRDALRDHAGLDNACFSLLRGMSELHIAQLFATTTKYDSLVCSCNFAFRMSHQRLSERWCNDCPKCQFVFLALAPFTDRARLVGIFGADLLADESHLDSFRELLGLAGHKPFECVGELAESRVAAMLLASDPVWADSPIVTALAREMPDPPEEVAAAVLTAAAPRFAPPRYAAALEAMQILAARTNEVPTRI